jgi:hypothetical protein
MTALAFSTSENSFKKPWQSFIVILLPGFNSPVYSLNPFGEHALQAFKLTPFQMVGITPMISFDVDSSCSLSLSLRKPNSQKSHELRSGE